jgi:plastocyanin
MARRGLVIIVALCMGIGCLNGLIYAAEEEAEELKVINEIVRISAKEGAAPSNLTSKPGTTVIWVNNARSTLEVLFLDKKVTLACGSPVNFFVGEGGAYESGKIPYGGTASLCFTQKGVYEYVVTVSRTYYKAAQGGLAKEHRGQIIIK